MTGFIAMAFFYHSFLFGTILLTAAVCIVSFLSRRLWAKDPEVTHAWFWKLFDSARLPLFALLGIVAIHYTHPYLESHAFGAESTWLPRFDDAVILVITTIIAWSLYRWIAIIERQLRAVAQRSSSRLDDFIYSFLAICARAAIPPIAIGYLVFRLTLSPAVNHWIEKIPAIALILAAGWVLFRAIALGEQVVIHFQGGTPQSLEHRRVITRTRLLRQIAAVMITCVIVGSILMLFQQARALGTSLLASAGVATVIFGLAAQRTFGTIFAGIQIALTQPVRIGDQVNVDSEFGTVEEITLTYVIIRTWDLRNLVVPISYFIEHSFQNWTRTTTNLTATVFLNVDFSAPVDVIRAEFERLVHASANWNKVTCALHVSDSDENCMQLRMIAGAENSGKSWALRCEIREKMIAFLWREYPSALPRSRSEQKAMDDWGRPPVSEQTPSS